MSLNTRNAGSRKPAPVRQSRLLKDRAYESLKQLILRETFQPGDFLSERQLAARLKMSKTPIKSALERLESEGFIAVSPRQGIVVQDLTLDEITDHYEVREALETYVMRRLAGRLSAEQIARMRENLAAQQASVEERDGSTNCQLDSEFHLLWCEFFGNREIIDAMRRLCDRIHIIITRVNSRNPSRLHEGYEEHVRIAEAVIAGNADVAARAVEEHLQSGKLRLLATR